jgi:hypothetical protein
MRKVMGGGGGDKNKNRAGKTERKFAHQKSLKKKFVQRLFNRENYQLNKKKFVQGSIFKKLSTEAKN